MKGCVYLIGAGCGAADLITVRGIKLLRTCDVVVYDDLIDEALLEYAPSEAERVYMGKRNGKHSACQQEITALLIDRAKAGKKVVRLKGGDPFVFGRGGEEALDLASAGVPCQIVPGVSSAIAIPALAGIPVTQRGLSRSFHVVTGHTADTPDGMPQDMEALARLHGTLVFLMGLAHLEALAQSLMAHGKDPATPAAVVSGGNSANPAAVRGILDNIALKTREAGVKSPAVIVVGETAALNLEVGPRQVLREVHVGLTGTPNMAGKLQALLLEQGARVSTVERSIVRRLPLDINETLICDGNCHWLTFTSANGVRIFFDFMDHLRVDKRRMANCKFAVIGASTGAVLEEHGFIADLCPEVYTSEALAKALVEVVGEEEDVILLRARKASAILPKLLEKRGIPTIDVPLYDLSADPLVTEHARDLLPTLDYLTFSSGGGVDLYFKEHGVIPKGTTCVCIGEVTALALRERYRRPFLMAKDISAQGIVDAIVEFQSLQELGGSVR